jgi:hypothetical protein
MHKGLFLGAHVADTKLYTGIWVNVIYLVGDHHLMSITRQLFRTPRRKKSVEPMTEFVFRLASSVEIASSITDYDGIIFDCSGLGGSHVSSAVS